MSINYQTKSHHRHQKNSKNHPKEQPLYTRLQDPPSPSRRLTDEDDMTLNISHKIIKDMVLSIDDFGKQVMFFLHKILSDEELKTRLREVDSLPFYGFVSQQLCGYLKNVKETLNKNLENFKTLIFETVKSESVSNNSVFASPSALKSTRRSPSPLSKFDQKVRYQEKAEDDQSRLRDLVQRNTGHSGRSKQDEPPRDPKKEFLRGEGSGDISSFKIMLDHIPSRNEDDFDDQKFDYSEDESQGPENEKSIRSENKEDLVGLEEFMEWKSTKMVFKGEINSIFGDFDRFFQLFYKKFLKFF